MNPFSKIAPLIAQEGALQSSPPPHLRKFHARVFCLFVFSRARQARQGSSPRSGSPRRRRLPLSAITSIAAGPTAYGNSAGSTDKLAAGVSGGGGVGGAAGAARAGRGSGAGEWTKVSALPGQDMTGMTDIRQTSLGEGV